MILKRLLLYLVLVLYFIITGICQAKGQIDSTMLRMPVFSWDHVPLYMHMRKSTAFTQAELEYLAEFPIITLEKTTGSTTYGSTEKGSREAAKAIKAINPDAVCYITGT